MNKLTLVTALQATEEDLARPDVELVSSSANNIAQMMSVMGAQPCIPGALAERGAQQLNELCATEGTLVIAITVNVIRSGTEGARKKLDELCAGEEETVKYVDEQMKKAEDGAPAHEETATEH